MEVFTEFGDHKEKQSPLVTLVDAAAEGGKEEGGGGRGGRRGGGGGGGGGGRREERRGREEGITKQLVKEMMRREGADLTFLTQERR